MSKKPPILRRRLGRRLKSLREQARMSLEEAARRLDKTRSALNRHETGQSKVDVHLVRSMMDLYDIYDEELVEQTREALQHRWFHVYRPEDQGYVDLETEAVTINEFAVSNLPGLLQTEPYMRALFGRPQLGRTPEQVENDVTVRLLRQRRLTSEVDPLDLLAIIEEAALRREIGGPEVMCAQLRHLVEAAEPPVVSVQVLPLRAGPHSSLAGAFIVLSFPEPDEPDMLYVSYPTGSLHIEDEQEVAAARLKFDQLRSEALDPARSAALIERLATELYGP